MDGRQGSESSTIQECLINRRSLIRRDLAPGLVLDPELDMDSDQVRALALGLALVVVPDPVLGRDQDRVLDRGRAWALDPALDRDRVRGRGQDLDRV